MSNQIRKKKIDRPDRKCQYCDFVTKYASSLRVHMNKHTKSTIFKCPTCEYQSLDRDNYKRHVNAMHTKEVVHSCPHCDYMTTNFTSLKRHALKRHNAVVNLKKREKKKRSFKCEHCDFEGEKNSSLYYHMKAKHRENKMLVCQFCDLKTLDQRRLNKHIERKHSDTTYHCENCSYLTPNRTYFKRHQALCKADVSFHNSVTAHTQIKLEPEISNLSTDETRFKCEYCSYKTEYPGQMEAHRSVIHTETQAHSCTFCSYTGQEFTDLKCHVIERHGAEIGGTIMNDIKTIYNCKYCRYSALDVDALQKHMYLRHNQCAEEVKKEPEQSSPDTVQLRKCPFCNYETRFIQNLKMHVNRHTRQNVFRCRYCTYEALAKRLLREHLARRHVEKTPCGKCGHLSTCYDDFQMHRKACFKNVKRQESYIGEIKSEVDIEPTQIQPMVKIECRQEGVDF